MNLHERELLGEFLRTRRARLTPAQAGLPIGKRRRTPGLRREEIAQLAGVSVTWYTWIEQGRDIHFSVEVLESLARVLHLPPPEKAYLFALAGMRPQDDLQAPDTPSLPTLAHIVEHQGHYPAYVMGRYWHLLAWNRAAIHLFGDFAAMPDAERNMLWYTFARPETRGLVVDWAERARRLIAEFRADCSSYLNDPALDDFLTQLAAASPEFGAWWSAQDVQARDGGRREFEHPTVGRLCLEQTTFRLSNHPDIKLVIHVPLPESETDGKLRMLQDHHKDF
jgi:transcriptional regulator with XRE-family HTH domain